MIYFSSSKRNAVSDTVADFCNLSLHQEDETIKPIEVPNDRNRSCQERIRTPSTESVFNHDAELIYQRFLEGIVCCVAVTADAIVLQPLAADNEL